MIKSLQSAFATLVFGVLSSTTAWALEVETHVTPDGREFAFVQMSDAAETYVRIVWSGGVGSVPEGKENILELAPYLMVQGGSVGMAPNELSAKVNAIGAGLQIYARPDALHGAISAPSDGLLEAAGLMNTVLSKPSFEARWLKRFQRGYVENVSANIETANGQAWRAMREVALGNHPTRQLWSAAPVENISDITIDEIRDWYERTVTSDGVRVFAAGDGDPEEVGRAIDVALAGLPDQSQREKFEPLEMHYPGKTILVHRPELGKSFLLFGGPIPKTYSEDQESREIGIGVLGVSDQSRLFTAVRKKLRASYGFSAWADDFTRDNSMIYLHGEVDTDKLGEAFDVVRDTYEEFRTGGIGIVEFPFASRVFKNRAKGMLDTPRSVANLMVEASLSGRELTHGIAYPERAADLSRSTTNAVIARDFPVFDQMTRIVVSPDATAVEADCVVSDFSEASQCR